MTAVERMGARVRGSDGRPGQTSDLLLSLPAEPDQVGVARRAVADFCELAGVPPPLVDDVKLVVTEACTNVVLHAYDGVPEGRAGLARTFDVSARIERDTLVVIVTDHGRGIGAPSVNRGLGLGLRLALQLAGGVHTREGEGGPGTRLTMRFALPR
jgi:anti-sigma regulatory factor (Ser/Thr protein kinase)